MEIFMKNIKTIAFLSLLALLSATNFNAMQQASSGKDIQELADTLRTEYNRKAIKKVLSMKLPESAQVEVGDTEAEQAEFFPLNYEIYAASRLNTPAAREYIKEQLLSEDKDILNGLAIVKVDTQMEQFVNSLK